MEYIFEALLCFVFEMFGEIVKEIIIGLPQILDAVAEKINFPIKFSGSSVITELKLFD